MKSVCFVLPSFSRYPVGGYKMVFEYANRLCLRGYKIKILFINDGAMKQYHIPEIIRVQLANFFTRLFPKWFILNESIEKISSCEKNYKNKLKDIDIFVATAVVSAGTTLELCCGRKSIYLIQDYEYWDAPEDYLNNTYSWFDKNIVIAKWIKEKVDNYSKEKSVLIQNPIDINIFKPNTPIQLRPMHSLAFLFHKSEHKGVKYVLQVVNKLRLKYPDLIVKSVGMYRRPHQLPEWIDYVEKASQKEMVDIYNSVQVFVCASIEEGFGLTGLEAMACGCVLASTSYDGVLEYANSENSLLSPVKNVELLERNIIRLFENSDLRFGLAQNGIRSAKSHSWEIALEKMTEVIEKV